MFASKILPSPPPLLDNCKFIVLFPAAKVTSLDMWNDYGFVSHIFESFKNNGLDINIITGEYGPVFSNPRADINNDGS